MIVAEAVLPTTVTTSRGEDDARPALEAGMFAGPAPTAPAMSSFAGIPTTAWQPPDCACAVGPDHVMLAVNTDLYTYSKAGVLQFKWPNMTALFQPVLPAGAGLFDPRLAYDHYAGRWIVIVTARRESPAGSWIMVGVSQGAEPGGAWWIWALDASLDGTTPTTNWADYPMVGFDTQAIYVVCNMFKIGGDFQYCKLRILNKAELYAGGVGPDHNIRWYDLWDLKNPDGSVAFSVQPCVHFRATGGNPAAYLVNAIWPNGAVLTFWSLSNPLGLWTGGVPALLRQSVACRSYELPPGAIQKGGTNRIATNDTRLLNAVYQHAGGVERVWTSHNSKFTWPGESEARSVAQWYEIEVPTNTIVQQNAYGAAGRYYFFPVIHTDASRNAYLVFSTSGADEFGSLRQTGRLAAEPPNSMQPSAIIKAGQSTYPGNRWGDYFGICRDGGDGTRVWGFGEFTDAGGHWGTWVASMKF
jgi:hypothetical protein